MKIQLLKLTLLNFKGQRDLTIDYEEVTNIYGDNAVGKTTIFDAFTWLLFGKDSTDRKDFEVKTLDKHNRVIEKIDHEVTGLFLINNREVTIKRGLREKWEKRRGGTDYINNGNEQYFFWDDVPLQAKQFQDKVNTLIPEQIFKLITNPFYFNSLKWQDRRATLLQIAGKIDDIAILDRITNFSNKQHVDAIINAFNQRKTLDEYKTQLAAKKKLIKDALVNIPARIDETKRMTPAELDYSAIELQIAQLQASIKAVEERMLDASKVQQANLEQLQQKQSKLHQARTDVQNITFAIIDRFNREKLERQSALSSLQAEISAIKQEIGIAEHKARACDSRIIENNTTLDNLRQRWIAENDKTLVFNVNEFCCPTCKREFEADKVSSMRESMQTNFNNNKATQLADIASQADTIKTQTAAIVAKLEELNAEIATYKTKLEVKQGEYNKLLHEHNTISVNADAELKTTLEQSIELRQANDVVSGLEYEINKSNGNVQGAVNTSALREQKSELATQLANLQRQLNTREQREKGLARVVELENEQSNLSQQLADLEGYEFAIEQFTRAKMDALVDRVNHRFSLVKFKMFDTQINGGQIECCETLINGVPFSDANNAARINAGLDIINVLSDHYDTYAPVIVDNAESVNELIPINGQLIKLVVSDDKQLRITHSKYVDVTVHQRMAV